MQHSVLENTRVLILETIFQIGSLFCCFVTLCFPIFLSLLPLPIPSTCLLLHFPPFFLVLSPLPILIISLIQLHPLCLRTILYVCFDKFCNNFLKLFLLNYGLPSDLDDKIKLLDVRYKFSIVLYCISSNNRWASNNCRP